MNSNGCMNIYLGFVETVHIQSGGQATVEWKPVTPEDLIFGREELG